MIKALQDRAELSAARKLLNEQAIDFSKPGTNRFWRALYRIRYRVNLPLADTIKSWDVLNAVQLIQAHVEDKSSPIADLGCFNSEILYCLHRLGYQNLRGCDLNPMIRFMPFFHRIRYERADLTATPYESGSLRAVTCLSVIEHGVPIDRFVQEVRRILQPGGLCLLTTDFDEASDQHRIDEHFRIFGQSWRIFDKKSFGEVVNCFQAAGFALLDEAHQKSSHNDRPIYWSEQHYTFIFAAFVSPS